MKTTTTTDDDDDFTMNLSSELPHFSIISTTFKKKLK